MSAELVATLPGRVALSAGAWLLVAPFALDYTTTGAGFRSYWSDVLVGIAVIVVAALRIAVPHRGRSLAAAAAGLGGWLIAAPFVLDVAAGAEGTKPAINDVLVGSLLVVLAALDSMLGMRARSQDERRAGTAPDQVRTGQRH
jgi:hypothetical protein